jgi:hypothetical protein
LASEQDDEWLDGACYLNMEGLREQRKVQLPLAARERPKFFVTAVPLRLAPLAYAPPQQQKM